MNTFIRLVAIFFIFICTVVAWMILGTTVLVRTEDANTEGKLKMYNNWGQEQRQYAPAFYYMEKVEKKVIDPDVVEYDEYGNPIETYKIDPKTGKPIMSVTEVAKDLKPDATTLITDLKLDQRKVGLKWFSSYDLDFAAKYTVSNPTEEEQELVVQFDFPSSDATYRDFKFVFGGEAQDVPADLSAGITGKATVPAGESVELEVAYKSRGMDNWYYILGDGVTNVKNLNVTVTTDFEKIDFPENTISPTEKTQEDGGWVCNWKSTDLISGSDIGVSTPRKMDPGPMATKITFFAPITLLFFFAVLFIVSTVTKNVPLHPMHFFFLACAFFAFHLLNSYLVDHVNIHIAFAISAAVSVVLVFIYLALVLKPLRALAYGTTSQLMFLVLFSYAWFLEGYTGLTITIGAIITLAVLMITTAKVKWDEKFNLDGKEKPRIPQTGE